MEVETLDVARSSKTPDFDISSGWDLSDDHEHMIDKRWVVDTYGSIIVSEFRGF